MGFLCHTACELQSHGAIAGSQAGVIDLPGLQYGLFHAQVRPNKLYGIVTTGIRFEGLNMDVGHVRSLRWVKDDNPASPINNKPELTANGKPAAQNRWIGYNKGKGQYNSAMEHATPEAFWVDKTQCRHTDSNGQVHNPSQPACAEGISAVKALALAQAQGQRIYTITPSNAATALPKLPVGGEVGAEIRNAIQAGKEVTIHENPITAHGWTGYGYIIVDPETGAGAYLIEGKGNGGFLLAFLVTVIAFIIIITALSGLIAAGGFIALASGPGLFNLLLLFWELYNLKSWIESMKAASSEEEFSKANFSQFIVGLQGILAGEAIVAAMAEVAIVFWFGTLMSYILTTNL